MRHANFDVVYDGATTLVIRDLGPWDRWPTITNDAEWVVEQVAPGLRGRRLLYFDSYECLDELLVREGRFVGFAPGRCRRTAR
jgi:hypothetical protein